VHVFFSYKSNEEIKGEMKYETKGKDKKMVVTEKEKADIAYKKRVRRQQS